MFSLFSQIGLRPIAFYLLWHDGSVGMHNHTQPCVCLFIAETTKTQGIGDPVGMPHVHSVLPKFPEEYVYLPSPMASDCQQH